MNFASIYAIIPARGGSKGVPGKNIKLLLGYPLIAFSIAATQLSQRITRAIVSTDSEEIAEIARRYGGEVPFLRPDALARDYSPDRDFVIHALNWFRDNEDCVPDYLVHIRPTTPLREPEVIDDAIDRFAAHPTATSLRSGHVAPESPFKWFTRDDRGYFQRLDLPTDRDLPCDLNAPRQGFPDVYVPNCYVDVLRTEFVLSADTIHGDAILGYESPVGYEVDTPEDFEFLQFKLTSMKRSAVLDYLRSRFPEED